MPITWTMQVPVLSTGHLTQQTMETLDQHLSRVARYTEGAFVYLGYDNDRYDEWPDDLKKVADWLWAEVSDLTWVRFDSDGDFVDELPKYEW